MCAGIVEVIVHAHHDVERTGLDRRRHDHLLDAGGEVRLQRLSRAELAAAFEDHIDAEPAPGRVRRLSPTRRRRPAAPSMTIAARQGDASIPSAVHGIERQQVRRGFGPAGDFVDVDERQVGSDQPARSARRPMRPKPLIPMRVAMLVDSLSGSRSAR